MKKKEKQADAARRIAEVMTGQWTDEYLLSKTPEDIMRAYGCAYDVACRVLNNQLTLRKLR